MIARGRAARSSHRLGASRSGRHPGARLRRLEGRHAHLTKAARQRMGGSRRQRQRHRAWLHRHRHTTPRIQADEARKGVSPSSRGPASRWGAPRDLAGIRGVLCSQAADFRSHGGWISRSTAGWLRPVRRRGRGLARASYKEGPTKTVGPSATDPGHAARRRRSTTTEARDATGLAALVAAGRGLTRGAEWTSPRADRGVRAAPRGPDGARTYDRARAATRTLPAGDAPFRGVPFPGQGQHSTSSPACRTTMAAGSGAGASPRPTSTLVARFRAAGLIVLGTTKVPELSLLPTSEKPRLRHGLTTRSGARLHRGRQVRPRAPPRMSGRAACRWPTAPTARARSASRPPAVGLYLRPQAHPRSDARRARHRRGLARRRRGGGGGARADALGARQRTAARRRARARHRRAPRGPCPPRGPSPRRSSNRSRGPPAALARRGEHDRAQRRPGRPRLPRGGPSPRRACARISATPSRRRRRPPRHGCSRRSSR